MNRSGFHPLKGWRVYPVMWPWGRLKYSSSVLTPLTPRPCLKGGVSLVRRVSHSYRWRDELFRTTSRIIFSNGWFTVSLLFRSVIPTLFLQNSTLHSSKPFRPIPLSQTVPIVPTQLRPSSLFRGTSSSTVPLRSSSTFCQYLPEV